MTRFVSNTNLTLISTPTWNGLPVQTAKGPLVKEYLERIHSVLLSALNEHPRTTIYRVDLRFPQQGGIPGDGVITRFIESLKAQIHAEDLRKTREGVTFHRTAIRFIWAREKNTSINEHYHVAIMVNKDRFYGLGTFKLASEYIKDPSCLSPGRINMSDRIRKAWASALGIDLVSSIGLVNFAGASHIDRNNKVFQAMFENEFFVLSYLAKSYSKVYGNHVRNFGGSHH